MTKEYRQFDGKGWSLEKTVLEQLDIHMPIITTTRSEQRTTLFIKSNSKRIIDLNVGNKTIKLWEENIGDLGLDKASLDVSPKHKQQKVT